MRTTKEELATWIEDGLAKRTEVRDEELSSLDRGAYHLVTTNILGIALIGKVGDAINAYRRLDLEFQSKGVLKIRSLTIADLAKELGLSLDAAAAINELHRLYQVPPERVTQLLRSL